MEILKNFIVFEGLDGAGTTTQSRLITDKQSESHFTFEPTDGEIGRFIRKVLGKEFKLTAHALAHLFTADRSEHLYGPGGIIELCRKGDMVICDRYLYSSIAYQSLNLDFTDVVEMNSSFPHPEHLFFIDTPVELCLERIGKRQEERELFEKRELLEEIQKNYYRLIEYYKQLGVKIHILDGTWSIEALLSEEVAILGLND